MGVAGSTSAVSDRAVSRRCVVDLILVAVLAMASYQVAVGYVRLAIAAGFKPEFYQFQFGPAVMLACGRGYVPPAPESTPALERFLRVEQDEIRCDELPAPAPLRPLSIQQSMWKYLMWSAAAIWTVTDVSWSRLIALSGWLFAGVVTGVFLLTRLVAGRVAATLAALAIMLSPLHWSQVPQIRDYSKAPFLIAIFAILSLMVRPPLRPKRVVAAAAAFGIVFSVGSGFRSDLLVVTPAFAAAVLFFLPGGIRQHLKLKAAAFTVAAVAFLGTAWPLFGAYAEGGGLQVVALLGLVTPFDEPLRVQRGPYEFGYAYSDWYMGAIIREFAHRQHGVDEPVPLYRRVYNTAGNSVIREVVRTMPADIAARAYASVAAVSSLPMSTWTDSHWPPYIPNESRWSSFFQARARLVERVRWLWPAAVAAALVLGSLLDLRLALFAAFLLFYFGGYPAIQFHERHFFTLSIVPVIAVAFVAGRVWTVIRHRSLAAAGFHRSSLAHAAIFVGVIAAIVLVPVATLRAYQSRTLRQTLAERLAAPRVDILLTATPVPGNRVLFEVGETPAQKVAQATVGVVTGDYLVARLGGAKCEALQLPVTLRYHAPFVRGDLSTMKTIALPLDPGTELQWLTPVFYRYRPETDAGDLTDGSSHYQFRGFEIDARDRDCIAGVGRIADPARFPLLLSATLAPDWADSQLYQTLASIERRRDADSFTIVTAPSPMRVTRRLFGPPLEPLMVHEAASALRATQTGWSLDGVGTIGDTPGPFTYLLMSGTRAAAAGERLVVDVVVRGGGLTVGLQREDRWLIHTPVVGTGRFLAVVEVPTAGPTVVVIANNLPLGKLRNSFEILRAGWIEAAPEL